MSKHEFKDSTNIAHIDYHEPDTLEICFKSGGTYHYKGCPKHHYENMKISESVGKYFHTHIRRAHKGVKQD
jgi:hypothetical protein